MSRYPLKYTLFVIPCVLFLANASGQQRVLGMKEAIQMAEANYGSIKAKADQLNASKANMAESKTEYLPDLTLGAQQVYGTANSAYGPLYSQPGSAGSGGPITGKTNWNAAFGALYLSNVNWNFFAFGRAIERVKVQQRNVNLNETDLAQEQFQHEVRVAGAYLNLLAAQELAKAQADNLQRAMDVRNVVVARVRNGLNPGVDSSQANAQVANARIALTNAQETEAEQANTLAQYITMAPQQFSLDSTFVTRLPASADPQTSKALQDHPVLQFYQNRINVSDEQAKYLNTYSYPTFSLFGVLQGRGSGFYSGYGANPGDFSGDYFNGIKPDTYNYLVGVGVSWNFTNVFRVHNQVKAQKYLSAQYKDEYDLAAQQIQDQAILAETKIKNALKNNEDAPAEVKAATDEFTQKSAQYKNGLTNIVDYTQALYDLNRAEIDNYIARNNVWQALLYKAAATGDFGLFINNF